MTRSGFLLAVWGAITCGSVSAWAAPTKVACVGASTTSGSGSTAGHHYPDELGRLLGADYQVKNFGVGSTTILKAGDKPYWGTAEQKAGLAFTPDVAVFWFGGNDAKPVNWTAHKADFEPDYQSLIEMYQALPTHPRTYVILSLVFHDVEGIPKDVIDNELLPMVRDLAVKTHSGIVDVHGQLANHPEWFPDGIHPNDMGTVAVAKLVQQAMLATSPGQGGPVVNDAAAGDSVDGPAADAAVTGSIDAASPADAGVAPDAGTPGAGTPDDGTPADAGTVPPETGGSGGSTKRDGAVSSGVGSSARSSGGCAMAGGAPASGAPLALLGLVLAVRARRRRR